LFSLLLRFLDVYTLLRISSLKPGNSIKKKGARLWICEEESNPTAGGVFTGMPIKSSLLKATTGYPICPVLEIGYGSQLAVSTTGSQLHNRNKNPEDVC